jgi:hypothetical protein
VKHPKEKFNKITTAMKRKTFNLTDFSGRDNSGRSEMIGKLKKKFHIIGKG